MKNIKWYLLILIALLLGSLIGNNLNFKEEKEKELPKPELSEGMRGTFGIDKNINEKTIDNYLNRKDSVYRYVRMLVDEADYEAIGGDSYLSGIIDGFEVTPLPKIVNVNNLPEEVGDTYQGETLFTLLDDGKYNINYKESMDYLEYHFPKDKNIFLMCGGGGYAGMMKDLLISLGWDKDKIYNVGGHWFYEGNNNIQIKKTIDDKVTYDFYKLKIYDIDFEYLEKIK